jgi:hypothetical protein
MSKIILDEDLRAKLNGLDRTLEVCDQDGNTVGHFLPAADYRKLLYAAVNASCKVSDEELDRRSKEGGGSSLAEFWKRMGVS